MSSRVAQPQDPESLRGAKPVHVTHGGHMNPQEGDVTPQAVARPGCSRGHCSYIQHRPLRAVGLLKGMSVCRGL